MRRSLFAVLLSISLAAPLAAHSQPLYNMRFLPPHTTPHAIDALGRIVGVATDGRALLWSRGVMTAQRAFLYAKGVMQDLATRGGPSSSAAAINERGEVAGTSFVNGDIQHAFLYRDGVRFDLNDLVARRGIWTVLDAVGINDARQIAAYACTEHGCRAVLLEPEA